MSRRRTSRSTWSRRCWSSSSRCACAGRCRLALASGALIGTVGLAAEWGWTHVWMPLPWPAALLPEGLDRSGFAMAVAGVVRGRLARRPADHRPHPVAARRGGGRRGGDLRAHRLTACLERVVRACAGRSTGVDGRRTARLVPRRRRRRRRTGSPPPPGRAAGWSSTGWSEVAPGVYRTTAADPARRRLEDDDPPALAAGADRAAGLPARRPGDPGRRDSRRSREFDARVRARAAAAPARAQDRRRRLAVGGRVRRRAGDRARVPRRAGVGRAPRLARPRPDLTLPVGRRARARRSAARSRPRRPAARTRAATATAGRARRTSCPAARPRRSRAPASR